MININYTL